MGIEPWLRDGSAAPTNDVRGEEDGLVGIEPWLQRGGEVPRGAEDGEGSFGIEPWLMDGRIPDPVNITRADFDFDSL